MFAWITCPCHYIIGILYVYIYVDFIDGIP